MTLYTLILSLLLGSLSMVGIHLCRKKKWFVVAAAFLLHFFWDYFRYHHSLCRVASAPPPAYMQVWQQVLEEFPRAWKGELLLSPGLSTPLGIGIFRKRILLPWCSTVLSRNLLVTFSIEILGSWTSP